MLSVRFVAILVKLPAMGIALLHGIPAIGTKFEQASGQYKGSVCLSFDNRK